MAKKVAKSRQIENIALLQHRAVILVLQAAPVISLLVAFVFIEFGSFGGSTMTLIAGVAFLAISFTARHYLSPNSLPGSSTMLALFFVLEFLLGARFAAIGIMGLVSSSTGVSTALKLMTVFGLLLVTDSLLLYRREFKNHKRWGKRSRSGLNPAD